MNKAIILLLLFCVTTMSLVACSQEKGMYSQQTNTMDETVDIHDSEKNILETETTFSSTEASTAINAESGFKDDNDAYNSLAAPATDFQYTIVDGEVTLDKYIGNSNEIIIPSRILENLVTVIGSECFYKCDFIELVTLPDTINYIDGSAFSYCTALRSIELSPNITYMDIGALSHCESLESLDLPSRLTTIREGCFAGNIKLEKIIFPEGLSEIYYNTCAYCKNLKEVTIPSTVVAIGNGAFADCTSLEYVNFSEGLRSIDKFAFSDCISLKSIKLPESVRILGEYAFKNCSALETINLENIETMTSDVFEGCLNLKY